MSAPCIFEHALSGIQTHWISGGLLLEFGVDALSHSATTAEFIYFFICLYFISFISHPLSLSQI